MGMVYLQTCDLDQGSCCSLWRDEDGDIFIDTNECVMLDPASARALAVELIALADAEDAARLVLINKRCDAIAQRISEGLRHALHPEDLAFYEANRYRSSEQQRSIDSLNLD